VIITAVGWATPPMKYRPVLIVKVDDSVVALERSTVGS
jgi:hypothetical protein